MPGRIRKLFQRSLPLKGACIVCVCVRVCLSREVQLGARPMQVSQQPVTVSQLNCGMLGNEMLLSQLWPRSLCTHVLVHVSEGLAVIVKRRAMEHRMTARTQTPQPGFNFFCTLSTFRF